MIDEAQLAPYHTEPLPVQEGPWLVFAPHADDETFGMGGTLALATQAGIEVHLVVVTDGALGGSGDDLVELRQEEARKAAATLGVAEVDFMNQPDRSLPVNEQTLEQVAALLEKYQPKAVFFPGIAELHPDHRACALLVWQALQAGNKKDVVPVSYEIAVQSPINTLIDITPVMEIKRRAMAVYLSQLNERHYEKVVLAMNTLRTLTLDKNVQYAEGFFVFPALALTESLEAWAATRIKTALA